MSFFPAIIDLATKKIKDKNHFCLKTYSYGMSVNVFFAVFCLIGIVPNICIIATYVDNINIKYYKSIQIDNQVELINLH